MNSTLRTVPIVGAPAASALTNLGSRVTALPGQTASAVTGLRNFGQQVQVQQSLARLSGQQIGVFGGTVAALATRLPGTSAALAAMGRSFTAVNTPMRTFGSGLAAAGTPLGAFAGGLSRVAGVGLGSIAAGITGIARAGAGLFSALGGIPGLLITGVVVGLSLFAQKSAEAKQKSQEFQSAIREIKGTLDEYTGSITDATGKILAKNLAEDGSLLSLTKLGISSKDYLAAIEGQPDAVQRVTDSLTKNTQANLLGSDAWKNHSAELQDAGVSLDLVTRAASGDAAALTELNNKVDAAANKGLPVFGDELRGARDDLLEAAGSSAKLADKLGVTTDQLRQAQEQARLAAEATKSFEGSLKNVSAALPAIAAGGKVTAEIATGLRDVTSAARETAGQVGGDLQAKFKSLDAGAQGAAKSMQDSRQASIDAAVGAGATAEQAGILATRIGLIPKAAEISFRSNATGVQAEMITLGQQIQAVPAGKQVIVEALTDPARAQLETLGFTVTNLPDGTIGIDGNTDAARGKLADLQTILASSVGVMLFDADKAPAIGKLNDVISQAGGSTGVVSLDGNPTLVNGKIVQSVTFADGSKGTITLDGNPNPATGKVNGVVSYGNGKTTTIQVALGGVGAANSALDSAARRRIAYIDVVTRGGGSAAVGNGVRIQHNGGLISAFAKGGISGRPTHLNGHRLTPMRGGLAGIVPPSTYRIVGDRVKDDELYPPLNGSARSKRLFEIAAQRMGYSVSAYANGALASNVNRAVAARSASVRSSSSVDVVAAITRLDARLAGLERGDIIVNQVSHNPVAETATGTLTRGLRTLSQAGAFG